MLPLMVTLNVYVLPETWRFLGQRTKAIIISMDHNNRHI